MKNFDRTWVQIDLGAIHQNYQAISNTFTGVQVMTVLKGNAYGHGIRGILPVCEQHTDAYAVATVEEGLQIRKYGSRKPVLIFGPVPTVQMALAAAEDLTFTVGDLFYAQMLNSQLQAAGLTATCHIKIDTGLNRTGIHWREDTRQNALDHIAKIHAMPCLRVTGTYTHFACPESPDAEDVRFTQSQFDRFQDACNAITQAGLATGLRHCCATGGALAHPEYRLDMVRLGMMVYGQCDTEEHQIQLGLKEALSWKSRLIHVETVASGESVSYGRTYQTEKTAVIGVVSCGYADGYRRSYQSFGCALVGGKKVPVIGRICMDYLLLDLTEVPDPASDMEVVLLGSQKSKTLTTVALAKAADSVCGEVTGAISARVPRYYV